MLHVDLDQFIAAVEVLRRPELAGRPVIVGGRGDPTERAVVSTASYEARAFGVGSGMPLRVAARKVPDAVILPVDAEHYLAASEEVMATLRAQPDATVQVLGWDEAFVGTRSDDPEGYARAIQAAVLERTRLHCSVGIGDTLVRAKVATGFGKPRGVFRLTADNWLEVMGDRPTIDLWGVGSKISRRLADGGITTVAQLAAVDPADLVGEFGPRMGPWYAQLGRGEGSSVVDDTPWVARGHSRETTFQQDLTEPEQVEEA
ncbi:MAG TPA: DNA polymerase IV, partial [Naasia sp.]